MQSNTNRPKVFMLQYRTNSGVRRKPALGQFGELTVELARSLFRKPGRG
jgi:hypothetical protein